MNYKSNKTGWKYLCETGKIHIVKGRVHIIPKAEKDGNMKERNNQTKSKDNRGGIHFLCAQRIKKYVLDPVTQCHCMVSTENVIHKHIYMNNFRKRRFALLECYFSPLKKVRTTRSYEHIQTVKVQIWREV